MFVPSEVFELEEGRRGPALLSVHGMVISLQGKERCYPHVIAEELEPRGPQWKTMAKQELNAELLRPGQPSSVVNISKISFSRNTERDERSQDNPLTLSVFPI